MKRIESVVAIEKDPPCEHPAQSRARTTDDKGITTVRCSDCDGVVALEAISIWFVPGLKVEVCEE